MNPEEFHDDVGSASFQFAHRRGGSVTRFCFNMKVGENPDFWKARLLMPGAEFQGIIHGVFECDDGAVRGGNGYEKCTALLHAGRSTFKIDLMARDYDEFVTMCREIGALSYSVSGPTRWQRTKCVLRWFWERRPVLRWRSPLNVFD